MAFQIVRRRLDSVVVFAGGNYSFSDDGTLYIPGAVARGVSESTHEIIDVDSVPSDFRGGYYTYNGLWSRTEYGQAAHDLEIAKKIANARAGKQAEIDSVFELCVSEIKSGVLQAEIDTFDVQEKEAKSYQINDQSDVPFISALATARGITVADLASRILAKANQYKEAMAPVLGRKHMAEDALSAAETVDDILAIEA